MATPWEIETIAIILGLKARHVLIKLLILQQILKPKHYVTILI
jgi:hypothetical protein